jgi:hypothetical protein
MKEFQFDKSMCKNQSHQSPSHDNLIQKELPLMMNSKNSRLMRWIGNGGGWQRWVWCDNARTGERQKQAMG